MPNELTRQLLDDELMHHGVMGMHWGIRRYQPYGEGGYDPKHKGKNVGEAAKPGDQGEYTKTIKTTRKGFQKALRGMQKMQDKYNADAKYYFKEGRRYKDIAARRYNLYGEKIGAKKTGKIIDKAEERYHTAEQNIERSKVLGRQMAGLISLAMERGYNIEDTYVKKWVNAGKMFANMDSYGFRPIEQVNSHKYKVTRTPQGEKSTYTHRVRA